MQFKLKLLDELMLDHSSLTLGNSSKNKLLPFVFSWDLSVDF